MKTIILALPFLFLFGCNQDPVYFDMLNPKHRDKIQISPFHDKTSIVKCLPGTTIQKQYWANHFGNSYFFSRNEIKENRHPLNIAYRIYSLKNSKTKMTDPIYEGERTYLDAKSTPMSGSPRPLNELLTLSIKCPTKIGSYKLVVDFVQEAKGWHHLLDEKKRTKRDSRWVEQTLQVSQAIDLYPASSQNLLRLQNEISKDDFRVLQDAYKIAEGVLKASMFNYFDKIRKKEYLLTNAGSQYPMVWTRDMATVQMSLPFLPLIASKNSHWSELFFATMDDKNGLYDWISLDSSGIKDKGKNNILSDQELSTILGALTAIDSGLLSKKWLSSSISTPMGNMSHQMAIKTALNLLLESRWDKKVGCLWTGHVADWGDVGLKGKDIPTSTSFHGPRVCSLFSQSLLYRTLKLLESQKIASFPDILAKIRRFTNNHLWLVDKGYFKVHYHLDPIKHDFNEKNMFALGGHVHAMESGLVEDLKIASILKVIIERQKRFQISTISASILPPYPKGTFENPILDEEFEYQNGGQWDWYGPRAALFIYRKNKTLGLEKFLEIARKVVGNKTFYEWEHPSGKPGAGPHYRASAAAFIYSLNKGPMKRLKHASLEPVAE